MSLSFRLFTLYKQFLWDKNVFFFFLTIRSFQREKLVTLSKVQDVRALHINNENNSAKAKKEWVLDITLPMNVTLVSYLRSRRRMKQEGEMA